MASQNQVVPADQRAYSCLFSRFIVVTPTDDAPVQVLRDAYVAVYQNSIRYAGLSEQAALESLPEPPAEIIDGRNKMLLPAMANTHTHIPMVLMRNQADDLVLQDWLFSVIFPREERLTEQSVYWGSLLGMAEMIRNGIGAAAEMYYFNAAEAQAALETGFRLNLSTDAKYADASGTRHLNAAALEYDLKQYQQHPSGLLRVALMVHSVYLYPPGLYSELAAAAESLGCDVQIHVSETRREVDDCLAQYGCRPPRQLEKFGFFKTRTIAAHCVHLDDSDRQILASHPVMVAHNPSSNLKLGSGFADLSAMARAGIRIGLGTDGAASNNNLDLYREMRLASLLAKSLTGDAAALPAGQALDMATRQGMVGMGFGNSGCIAAGRLADIQIVDCDRPSMTPLGDPVAALVYGTDAQCVDSLMVNGRWLMRKRELLTIDEEKVLFEARRAAQMLNQ
jgi:5-methylthioadenosine/S-adenosylhomocysteine deaminase